MSKRNLHIDTLRGIACLLLVGTHVIGYNTTSGIRVPDDSPYRYLVDSFVYLRMPLFSFLAGVVYGWRPLTQLAGYGTFMGKKARRLLVPFLIFVPLIGVAQTLTPDSNNPTELSWYEWFLYPLAPYWFLIAAFWIFAFVSVADAKGWLNGKRVVLAVIAGVIAIDATVPDVPKEEDFLGFRSALFLLTFFLVGLAASRFNWQGAALTWQSAVAAAAVALFALTQLQIFDVLYVGTSRHALVPIFLGVAGCLTLLAFKWESRWLAWIGDYSSGIFLIHSFAIAASRAILGRLGVDSPHILFASGMLLGILGSIAAVHVARRLPAGRFVLGESAPKKRRRVPAHA